MSTFATLAPVLPITSQVVDGELHIGGVAGRTLADAYGTPLIVYDEAHVRRAASAWVESLATWPAGSLVAYASKAFSSVGMLEVLAALGLGADVASAGELGAAQRAGVDTAKIVLHGNNKSRSDLEAAVAAGVGLVVVDAPQELELLESVARAAGQVQPLLVRLNPDIEVETHRYISTSHGGSKFGVPSQVAAEMLVRAEASPWLDAEGVHLHLGSQLLDTDPWQRVLDWLCDWAVELQASRGLEVRTLDVGGGLGIAYLETQQPPTPADIAAVVTDVLNVRWREAGLRLPRLIVEPGRSIVGQAAVTLYRIGVTKDAGLIRYVNVDGGMSDNPRPVLYQARYRALLAERAEDEPVGAWWVAGVHCESGDVLIEDADLPEPRPGELLAVAATGAYAASMASTYNMVPRAAVVMVQGGEHRVLLRRERVEELFVRDTAAPEYRV
ncbi:MAG: diaminopimelate decarboxylase [Thermoleophilia bacterium]|nr:diaminopimelate decarboxylase [Thermoleophilia bacterium]